jgi:hypothetical protein
VAFTNDERMSCSVSGFTRLPSLLQIVGRRCNRNRITASTRCRTGSVGGEVRTARTAQKVAPLAARGRPSAGGRRREVGARRRTVGGRSTAGAA